MTVSDKLNKGRELSSLQGLPCLSEEETKKFIEIYNRHSDSDTFTLDGEVFAGIITSLYRRYCLEKSSKKFRIWMIDKGLRIS